MRNLRKRINILSFLMIKYLFYDIFCFIGHKNVQLGSGSGRCLGNWRPGSGSESLSQDYSSADPDSTLYLGIRNTFIIKNYRVPITCRRLWRNWTIKWENGASTSGKVNISQLLNVVIF